MRAVAKVLIISKEGLVAINLLLNIDYFFVASKELIGHLTAIVVELPLKRDTLIVCEEPVNDLQLGVGHRLIRLLLLVGNGLSDILLSLDTDCRRKTVGNPAVHVRVGGRRRR